MPSISLTFVGHSTVGIEVDGLRILTDPLLRQRVAHLYRYGPPPDPKWMRNVDAALVSHLHLDHCDIPSLRRLGRDTPLVVPRGAGRLLRRRGFQHVTELSPGEATALGAVTVTATPAQHSGFRPPSGPTAIALGFVLTGSRRIYFAGDTDLFPGMAELGHDLDVALIPIAGWGRRLGPGHLDPQRAAEALRLLHPSLAIPIHWGTFARFGLPRSRRRFLTDPPDAFVRSARDIAPHVTVEIVPPGESVVIAGNIDAAASAP